MDAARFPAPINSIVRSSLRAKSFAAIAEAPAALRRVSSRPSNIPRRSPVLFSKRRKTDDEKGFLAVEISPGLLAETLIPAVFSSFEKPETESSEKPSVELLVFVEDREILVELVK